MNLLIFRAFFVLVLAAAGWFLRPFDLPAPYGAAVGVAVGLAIVLFEIQVRKTTLKRLFGAAFGSLLGIVAAYLTSLILARAFPANSSTLSFVEIMLLLWMGYVGLIVGATKGDMLNLGALGGLFGGEQTASQAFKILDTSVIIDGRIADIVETGFLDGSLVIPQFVLRELQLVADSADSLKRNRGRRGLDVLQRIQKMTQINVQILEDDFPNVREVDMKLIELAKVYSCKIVTNDFNLNKVAQLHGVEVLNINRARQRPETDRTPRRNHARLHLEGRQGVQSGRRLPRRRHHGRGRQRQENDFPHYRHLRNQRPTDHRR